MKDEATDAAELRARMHAQLAQIEDERARASQGPPERLWYCEDCPPGWRLHGDEHALRDAHRDTGRASHRVHTFHRYERVAPRMRSETDCRAMLQQHRTNLGMWKEPDGFLVPTEPDPKERAFIRARLAAAIATLEWFLKPL